MTVVLVDPRRPALVPIDAIALLTGDVQYTEEMPIKVPWSLPSARPCFSGAQADPAAVLLSSDVNHPSVVARIAAGEKVISVPGPQSGERLVDAVALMDKLRTAGPWESQQTHGSLRRYLLEETYELFDAVDGGDLSELRDELGDVLLQVLFHARIAQDADEDPFDVDDVADALVRKLANRVPAVLAGESISLEDQLAQWEHRKAAEKRSKMSVSGPDSAMDGISTAQPALALAQKVLSRVAVAKVPADLIPNAITSISVSADGDAESALRSAVLEFMNDVRAAERAVNISRLRAEPEALNDALLTGIGEDEWRTYWPAGPGSVEDGRAPE
ncbi:nucleoside triphosphate pyrophosphohydrolase [Mycolicibacterium cyprinidarum]|uniref:Nucleoside triphosphate pyrophosphohydrolase n=1 Tax=Mycolicibacterium cyprinidarum TaxID=2860311 RepID=A0ABQ4VBQ2_9MYCO|nr:nucleoside triphosphate pyrophosphohydrolase [Mycolicibacterium sp. NGTWSNA01]GJF17774.1 nucleoside triphosphate pyrophosphohydrolase [Mycolicibacterium sp. NGTWS0302]